MRKGFAEQLLTKWAWRHGLVPLHIDVQDSTGITRLWWFYDGDRRQSSYFGMCDDDAVTFFAGSTELTGEERRLIDEERRHG